MTFFELQRRLLPVFDKGAGRIGQGGYGNRAIVRVGFFDGIVVEVCDSNGIESGRLFRGYGSNAV